MRKTNMNDFYRPTRRWWAALLLVLGVQVSMPTLAQEYQEIPDPTSDGPYNPCGAPAASSSEGYPIPKQRTREDSRHAEISRQIEEEARKNMEALFQGIGEAVKKNVGDKKKKKEEEEDDHEYVITPDGHGDDDHGDNGYNNGYHDDDGDHDDYPHDEDYHHGDYYEEHDHAGVVGTVAVTAIGTLVSVALGTTVGAAVGAAAGGAIGGSVGGVVGGAAGAVAGTVPPPPPPSPGTPPSPPDFPNLPDSPDYPEEPEFPEDPEIPERPDTPEEPEDPDPWEPEPDPEYPDEPEQPEYEEEGNQEEESWQDGNEPEDPEEPDEPEQPEYEEEGNQEEDGWQEGNESEEQEGWQDGNEPEEQEEPDPNEIEPESDPWESEPEPEYPDEPEQPEYEEERNQEEGGWQDGNEPEEQEEPDPNKFVPKKYAELCEGRVTQQPDGDIIVRDPKTGKETMHYYCNGDGTWFTRSTVGDPEKYVTQEEIEDRIRFEAEHSDYVKDVADKAAAAQKKQHEDLVKYIQDAEKNHYTDEEYHKLKQRWEEEEHHQDVLDKLALKYCIVDSSDEKAIRKASRTPVIKIETDQAIKDLKWATAEDLVYSVGIIEMDYVDKTCETAMYALGAANPGYGSATRDVYIVLRSTGIAQQEARFIRDPNKAWEHQVNGFRKGAITAVFSGNAKVLSDTVGGGIYSEGAMYIGSEGLNGAITGKEKGTGVVSNAAKGMGKKTIAFAIAKGTGAIANKAISDANVVRGVAAATAKGGMNAYSFVTETVPDTWGAAKRFINVMRM